MIIDISICAVIILLASNLVLIQGGLVIVPPPTAAPTAAPGGGSVWGLAIGLGAGLPFICSNYYSLSALQRLLKRLFKFEATAKPIPPIDYKKIIVKCPDELHWTNDPHDAPCNASFYEIAGLPSGDGKKKWKELMGNTEMPNGNYFCMAAKKTKHSINLISNVMESQLEDGEIGFNYWLTTPVTLNVCLLHRTSDYKEPLNCSKPIRGGKKHKATVPIKGPIDHFFKITIRASNFQTSQGIAVINDINLLMISMILMIKSKFPDC